MPWGQQEGLTDLVQRLQSNDPGLTSLFILANRRFGSEDIVQLCSALEHNTVLKELYASNHALTVSDASCFAQVLRQNTTLQSLCIGNDIFGDEAATVLAEGLKQNSSLTKLDFQNKGLSAAGAGSIAQALAWRQQPVSLDLSHNQLEGTDLSEALRPAVPWCTCLDMSHCGVTAQGCGFLTQAERPPSRLEQVNFGGNVLDKAGARALTNGLRPLVSLQKLAINDTAIGDAGMSQLAEALAGLPHLAELDLASCGLTSASTMAQLTSLQRLHLQGNDITDASIENLLVAITSQGSLCSLDLSSNKQVGTSSISALGKLPGLSALSLFNCQLSNSAFESLTGALAAHQFRELANLNVGANNLDAAQLLKLLETLQLDAVGPNLKVLSLAANDGVHESEVQQTSEKLTESRTALDIIGLPPRQELLT